MATKSSAKKKPSDAVKDQTSVNADVSALQRVVIEQVEPQIDGGVFPIKRTVGDQVVVEADVFADGHDVISCAVLYRQKGQSQWTQRPMAALGNDRWRGDFQIGKQVDYQYTLIGWIDRFKTWHRDLVKKVAARQDLLVHMSVGLELVESAAQRASGSDSQKLAAWVRVLQLARESSFTQELQLRLADELDGLMAKYPEQGAATTYQKVLQVVVDRQRARFSTWYEMFPRSASATPGVHGTFQDCEARLPYVAEMGFDVLYLPPIHPVGLTHRKGRNNTTDALPDDPGSPWAIGSQEGGHTSVYSKLGTLADFRRLVAKAKGHGLELAIDIAFQCSPDHPYVLQHPEWFRHRPDGTIQYAENPPKKYQDIYPFDFESGQWQSLWDELKGVFFYWIEQGVQIFRVDNPHTKPFAFWQWVIAQVKQSHPDVLFLAEAFTRPKVMYRLAKLGFTQSYTYFAWRNTKPELIEYFSQLTQTQVREYFRPNLWPNTPDILTEYLQAGGRPAFMSRLILAATLSANYGIYGPAFELCENRPQKQGSEEYLDSEKYQFRDWDLDNHESLRHLIARVNRIRKENQALQNDWSLRFHPVDHEQLLCLSKCTHDLENVIVVVVNLDPHHRAMGHVQLSLETLGVEPDQSYQMHDMLGDARYLWQGSRNYVELDPQVMPAHIFRLRRHLRSEHDFDYYM